MEHKLYKDENGDWVCEHSTFKGLIGVGDTPEEAVEEMYKFLENNGEF